MLARRHMRLSEPEYPRTRERNKVSPLQFLVPGFRCHLQILVPLTRFSSPPGSQYKLQAPVPTSALRDPQSASSHLPFQFMMLIPSSRSVYPGLQFPTSQSSSNPDFQFPNSPTTVTRFPSSPVIQCQLQAPGPTSTQRDAQFHSAHFPIGLLMLIPGSSSACPVL